MDIETSIETSIEAGIEAGIDKGIGLGIDKGIEDYSPEGCSPEGGLSGNNQPTDSSSKGKPLEGNPLDGYSPEAQAVYNAGLEVFKYYHTTQFEHPEYNVNSSLYDIRRHFNGLKDTGGKVRMNSKSKDKRFNELYANLRAAHRRLGEVIVPKVYEYGFLKK